jgi:hypothetical protein
MKDSLFSENALQTIKKIRKIFLWTAVWILIGELIMGAIIIISQSWDISIGKIQGTFFLIAVALFVGVNNFIRMEKGNKVIQGFAITSLITNILWLVLATLLIWEAVPFYWHEEGWITGIFGNKYWGDISHTTAIAKIMLILVDIATACFWMSNIMAIKETVKVVKPLKITSIICELYCGVFSVVLTVAELGWNNDTSRWYSLSGLAAFAFLTTALAAWIISRTSGKDEKAAVERKEDKKVAPKTDDEIRAEVEEQVRREMIEKEVRERLEAEKNKKIEE